jgi:predicted murein hydrolase (TIGR00659 family)
MSDLGASQLVWFTVTLLVYQAALEIYRRTRQHPLANPVLMSVVVMIGVLLVTGTDYRRYFDGARLLHFLIGPATVALAIPLYAQLGRLRRMLVPLTIALLAGSLTAIASAVAIGRLCGAPTETLLALAPKSATMPIALGVAEHIGGRASLTALTVTMTGISGAVVARGLLNLLRIDDLAVRGFAVGVAAHAIGTAHVLEWGEAAVAFSALAMGLNGVATTVLVPLLFELLPGH